ncbi:MAG: GDP-mannose 4,6-dehydratase [Proteobacteria bacterium]|nr:GDP-mannose 4,6-dehydratase [Pseudomonadota bacterium]MBU1299223.1 GDP-mannose 4,6-dehydratase [Bacteroidota bacterium]MBU1569946.1 GDP-mannose 4,6-dehydratase [Pseudomonadota bacterium]
MLSALITGVTGQDGSYLAELLVEHEVQVIGGVRDPRTAQLIPSLKNRIELVQWDMSNQKSIEDVLNANSVDEIYNFAAFSSGEGMFEHPIEMGKVNGLGVVYILEAIRKVNPLIRFCQASSSEMFGYTDESPQSEKTPFNPRTPYGAAKLYAHSMIHIYRERYGLFACSAILFNHESPRRGLNFVPRKVARAAAAIKLCYTTKLTLGTLDARRDWGFAGDYVRAMQLMLKHSRPDDYVVATGVTHSIRELCECAFGYLDLDYKDFVRIENNSYRAPESVQLVGDATKARTQLGWEPEVGFRKMVSMMVDADLQMLNKKLI